jgi:hypothetical protein
MVYVDIINSPYKLNIRISLFEAACLTPLLEGDNAGTVIVGAPGNLERR